MGYNPPNVTFTGGERARGGGRVEAGGRGAWWRWAGAWRWGAGAWWRWVGAWGWWAGATGGRRLAAGRFSVGRWWNAFRMARSTRFDQAALRAVLGSQHGVIARRQAFACGMTHDALAHQIRPGGRWQRLLPGTYPVVTGTPTVEQKEMAVLLYAGPGGVLSGPAALHHLGIIGQPPAVFDVLIPAARQRQSAGFAVVHRTTRMPRLVILAGEREFVPPARALADTARGLTDLSDIRAVIDGAVQKGHCTLPLLADELSHGPMRGSARLRRVLDEVSAGIRSPAEAEFRDLILRAKLPEPMFNARLHDSAGAFIAIPDAWWPDAGVAAEVDSREWHLTPQDWERTMQRHAKMSRHGIIALHFTPHQIRVSPQDVVTTITGALSTGCARPRLPIQAKRAA
jgi:hypothetical protein